MPCAGARESGQIHQVAFTFRYAHGVARLREMLREGVIGQPFFVRMVGEGWGDLRPEVRVAWRHQAALAGAGMLADMGSHYFDLVKRLGVSPSKRITSALRQAPKGVAAATQANGPQPQKPGARFMDPGGDLLSHS